MAGPARAGLFDDAKSLQRVADFYAAIAGMRRLHVADEIVVRQSPGIELLVHLIAPRIAADIVVAVPPERREDSALKRLRSGRQCLPGTATPDVKHLSATPQWPWPANGDDIARRCT
jgi:hypothetical protein